MPNSVAASCKTQITTSINEIKRTLNECNPIYEKLRKREPISSVEGDDLELGIATLRRKSEIINEYVNKWRTELTLPVTPEESQKAQEESDKYFDKMLPDDNLGVADSAIIKYETALKRYQ